MSETWIPGVEILPGPDWKQGYWGVPSRTLDQIEGEVKHSAEGPWSALIGELMRPDRLASWTFSIRNNGHIAQHYPLESVTWHCGVMGDMDDITELIGNLTLNGEEYEGKDKLTAAQEEASYYISDQVRIFTPNSYGSHKAELEVNLWEHGWISNTICPNGRIDWPAHLAYLNREDDMQMLVIGREGGGGLFTLEGTHLSPYRWALMKQIAHDRGWPEPVIEELPDNDQFFDGLITYPGGN